MVESVLVLVTISILFLCLYGTFGSLLKISKYSNSDFQAIGSKKSRWITSILVGWLFGIGWIIGWIFILGLNKKLKNMRPRNKDDQIVHTSKILDSKSRTQKPWKAILLVSLFFHQRVLIPLFRYFGDRSREDIPLWNYFNNALLGPFKNWKYYSENHSLIEQTLDALYNYAFLVIAVIAIIELLSTESDISSSELRRPFVLRVSQSASVSIPILALFMTLYYFLLSPIIFTASLHRQGGSESWLEYIRFSLLGPLDDLSSYSQTERLWLASVAMQTVCAYALAVYAGISCKSLIAENKYVNHNQAKSSSVENVLFDLLHQLPPPTNSLVPVTQSQWLHDPIGDYEERFWNGIKWTRLVRSKGGLDFWQKERPTAVESAIVQPPKPLQEGNTSKEHTKSEPVIKQTNSQSIVGDLKDLTSLFDRGALTIEEFKAAKERILGTGSANE